MSNPETECYSYTTTTRIAKLSLIYSWRWVGNMHLEISGGSIIPHPSISLHMIVKRGTCLTPKSLHVHSHKSYSNDNEPVTKFITLRITKFKNTT